MKVNTKTWLKLALILVSGLCLYLFSRNDAFLYQQPIGKVVAVKQATPEKTTDVYNNSDETTRQTLTLEILNGKYRGQSFKVNNTYSSSGGLDQKYHLGQQIFFNIHEHRGQKDVVISHYIERDLKFRLIFIDSPNRCLFESDKFLLAFCNSGFALYCIIPSVSDRPKQAI